MSNPFYELLSPFAQPQAGGQLPQPAPMPEAPKRGKGEIILGILADGLAGLAGNRGVMAQQWGAEDAAARQQQQERVNWGLKRQAELEDYGRKLEMQNDPRYAKPDVAPVMRDAMAWQSMTPELRQAYEAMQRAKPQFIPDGMGGGQWAQPPQAGAPARAPQGVTFTPLDDGGPTPQASGGFRR